MSTRRHNPFASNASINTHRDSAKSARPPTYTSKVTTAPTYTSNEPGTTSAHGLNERVSAWSASLPSASSVVSPDSETLFDRAESSLTNTGSVAESSAAITRPAGPRYVYYRIYTEDGAIQSANPVYTDDPSLGRIMAKLVAPPHTAMTLKHCISNVETIDNAIPTKLFISASSQTPMDDAGRVSILDHPGPGCNPNEPMVLVATYSDVNRGPLDENTPDGVLILPQEGPSPFEPQYLYYRMYRNSSAVRSKQPADSNDPSVGCISVDSVAPPHSATSIMRCISKAEELDNSKQSQLFTSTSSESPIDDGYLSILTSDRPGSTPDDPMAFVELPTPPIPYPTFTKRIRVIQATIDWTYDPRWLNATVGEILRTANEEKEKPRMETYVYGGKNYQYCVFEAVNDAGKVGCEYPFHLSSIHPFRSPILFSLLPPVVPPST